MKTRELTRIALMGTILYVVFQAFSDILYLEMITFTILAFSQVFTRRETVLSCLLFAAVHLLLHGIMFWNIAYLIIFPAYGLLFSSCRGFLSRHPGCIPFYGAFFSFLTGQLVDLFCEAWGDGLSWINQSDGGPHEANFLKLDCSRVKRVFGWTPRWGVKDAIRLTVEWCREYEKDPADPQVTEIMDRQIGEMFQSRGL